MKVKSVTIETDKGDEITMGFEEVEDFMKAMRRLKKSCTEPKEAAPSEDNYAIRTLQQQLQYELTRIEEQRRAEALRNRMVPMYPPNTTDHTWDTIGSSAIKPLPLGTGLIGSTTV